MTEASTHLRPALEADAGAMATLHGAGISQGFLSSLGQDFLIRLYRRIVRFDGAFAIVADRRGDVVGFIAGTESVGKLYREFLLRDGIVAVARAAPRLLGETRRVLETLSYGRSDAGGDELPAAELLSVAVDSSAQGEGLGGRLVESFLAELSRRQVRAAKVVVAADNERAVRLYHRCGFRSAVVREIHRGVLSEVLVWP